MLVAVALGGGTIGAVLNRRAKKRSVARPLIVERSITIGKSADELYQLLRRPETLSRVMGRLAHIMSDGDGATHWSVKGPFERTLECDMRLVEDRPAERLHWESVPGSEMHNRNLGGLCPAPKDWGTEVSLQVRLDVGGGALGVLRGTSARFLVRS